MNKKDSSVKRGVASPTVLSLREALSMSKPAGYGDPTPVKQVRESIKGGGGSGKSRGGGATLKTKAGYDTNTKVNIGASKKSAKKK